MTPIQSRPYRPDPGKCCEGCCFGGKNRHADWCPQLLRPVIDKWHPKSYDFWRPADFGVLFVDETPPKTIYFSIIGPALSLPAENPHGPATKTGVVVCRHGNVEVYCPVCDGSLGREIMRRMYGLEFGGTKLDDR